MNSQTRLDEGKMADAIGRFHDQIRFALEDTSFTGRIPVGFDRVEIFGMGGSVFGADVFKDAFRSKLLQPVVIHRDYVRSGLYHAMETKSVHCLQIFCSFSGDTEETLSGLAQPSTSSYRVAITAGGQLLRSQSAPTIISSETEYVCNFS